MTTDMKISIDKLDLEILGHLESNGRKALTQIARETGVSVGTVHNRVKKMLANKTLTIIGRINPFHAGLNAFALIFLDVQPSRHLDQVIKEICQYPEVSFLGIITGDFNIHIDVMCRDNDHLYKLVHERISNITGVVNTKTIQVLRVIQWHQPSLQLLREQHMDEITNKK